MPNRILHGLKSCKYIRVPVASYILALIQAIAAFEAMKLATTLEISCAPSAFNMKRRRGEVKGRYCMGGPCSGISRIA